MTSKLKTVTVSLGHYDYACDETFEKSIPEGHILLDWTYQYTDSYRSHFKVQYGTLEQAVARVSGCQFIPAK